METLIGRVSSGGGDVAAVVATAVHAAVAARKTVPAVAADSDNATVAHETDESRRFGTLHPERSGCRVGLMRTTEGCDGVQWERRKRFEKMRAVVDASADDAAFVATVAPLSSLSLLPIYADGESWLRAARGPCQSRNNSVAAAAAAWRAKDVANEDAAANAAAEAKNFAAAAAAAEEEAVDDCS